ncbi:MAG: hypothetical protein OEY49_08555 [Candidatus Heimdallarchaeota archaeon]|nr:hypothetical protein [Candidatus Heimdallarchaeota archaeon]
MNYKHKGLFWFSLFLIDFGIIFSILGLFPSSIEFITLLSPTEFSSLGNTDLMYIKFLFGISGGLTISLGVSFLFISKYYIPEAKKYVQFALLTWFIIDTSISVISTFYYNVISNTIFLLLGLFAITKEK